MTENLASIVVRVPDSTQFLDPDPGETQRRRVRLVPDVDESTIGIIGWSTAGFSALELAVQYPAVPRLVLASVPYEESRPLDLSTVVTKTLLLFGAKDPLTGSSHGRKWQRALPNARLEMVRDGEHDLLPAMWSRILAHLAPNRTK